MGESEYHQAQISASRKVNRWHLSYYDGYQSSSTRNIQTVSGEAHLDDAPAQDPIVLLPRSRLTLFKLFHPS